MNRPTFTIMLRPLPGVDGTIALRALLKVALRSCGLRCISIRSEPAVLERRLAGDRRMKPTSPSLNPARR